MFTINTRFTSFLYLPITMISMISMIARSDMQRERARERIDRARRQWELEHGKLDQPLPFHLAGIITIKSRWQLLAFPAIYMKENLTLTRQWQCRWVGGGGWKREGEKVSSGFLTNDAALWCRCSYHGQIHFHEHNHHTYDHIAHISKTGQPQRKQCLAHLLDRAIGRAPATLILLPTIRIRSPILWHL